MFENYRIIYNNSTEQMHIDVQQAELLRNSSRKIWRAGLNGLPLVKQQESSSPLTVIWKKTHEVPKEKEAAVEILQKPRFSSVWVFLNFCDLEGNFFCLYLVFIFLWKLHHSILSGFGSYLSMVQLKEYILFWEQVISILWGGYHYYL